ncbi:MAG: glycosyltransferase, partial [Betaproteobacteria bacterium]
MAPALPSSATAADARAEFARVAASGRPCVVFIAHPWGGGIRRHMDDLAVLVADRCNVLYLEPAAGDTVTLHRPHSALAAHFTLPRDAASLAALLSAVGVVRLHFHHIHRLPRAVLDLPAAVGVPYDCTLHDHYAICPQYQLDTVDGRYCGEPDAAGCAACLAVRPAQWGLDIVAWRTAFGALLAGAARRIAPTQDVAQRIGRYFPGLAIDVWPHPEPAPAPLPIARIVVPGLLSPQKGLATVVGCAADAKSRGLPLAFHVLGATTAPVPQMPALPLTLSGEYDEADLAWRLAAERPDALFFPAQVPETWSYTLSAAMESGAPIVASALGAIGERLAGRPRVTLLRPDAPAADWNDALLRATTAARCADPTTVEPTGALPPEEYRTRYLAPFPAGAVARDPQADVRIDERCFTLPISSPAARQWSLAELYEAGVECGRTEARAELARRVGVRDRNAESPVRAPARRGSVGAARLSAAWADVARTPRLARIALTILRDDGPAALYRRVQAKLARNRGFRPRVTPGYRIESALAPLAFALTAGTPRVSIVIPVYGNALLTYTCLRSVLAHTPAGRYEVVVVDDASPVPASVELAAVTGVRFERNATN